MSTTERVSPAAVTTANNLGDFMAESRLRVERALDRWLPAATAEPASLHEAMRYAVLAGGKYVRPLLVYASGRATDAVPAALDGPACAVELIHAYSLVHDDLPAMDDDDLRRGRPTCHRAHGEAMAILAGDAMQALAFRILAEDPAMTADSAARLGMIHLLASASGSQGMAGGQAIDLQAVGKQLGLAALENMHLHKTGALIRAAVRLGAMSAAHTADRQLQQLDDYARCIGLAFQIRDDILDVEGETGVLGKQQGADQALNKPTYPALLGLDGAKRKAHDMHEQALACLDRFDARADALRWISAYIVERSH